jgi:hypothetical protein
MTIHIQSWRVLVGKKEMKLLDVLVRDVRRLYARNRAEAHSPRGDDHVHHLP